MTPVPAVVLAGPVPPWRSGIADQTVRLARALGRLGVPPLVLTFRRMYPRRLYPGASDRGPGGFPEDLDVRPVLDGLDPLSFRRAGLGLAGSGVRLLAVPWWTAYWGIHTALLLSAARRAAPEARRLLLAHNVFDHEASPVKRALGRLAFGRAHAFAAQNGDDAARLRSLAPGARVDVVPHPSEPCRALLGSDEARRRAGLPLGVPVFLFSGLLRPYKGWDVLLEAFREVRSERPDAVLVLAGEPWGEARRLTAPPGVRLELRYLADEERGVLFDACDAVVCPYRHATGSGIAADAIAHGRPVIGTRVAGLLEVVEDGASGLLVPPGDPGALAGALLRFLRDGLAAPLAQGASRLRTRFSPEAHARAILALSGLEA